MVRLLAAIAVAIAAWTAGFPATAQEIDADQHIKEYQDEIRQKRRHGMGYLGLGSTLAMLRIRYGDPQSLDWLKGFWRRCLLT